MSPPRSALEDFCPKPRTGGVYSPTEILGGAESMYGWKVEKRRISAVYGFVIPEISCTASY